MTTMSLLYAIPSLRLCHRHLRCNFDNGRAGGDGVIIHGGVAACQDHIRLTRDGGAALWCGGNNDGEAAFNGGGTFKRVSGLMRNI